MSVAVSFFTLHVIAVVRLLGVFWRRGVPAACLGLIQVVSTGLFCARRCCVDYAGYEDPSPAGNAECRTEYMKAPTIGPTIPTTFAARRRERRGGGEILLFMHIPVVWFFLHSVSD